MGALTRFERTPAPTSTDYVEPEKMPSAGEDVERAGAGPRQLGSVHPHHHHHHDIAAEKAVRPVALHLK